METIEIKEIIDYFKNKLKIIILITIVVAIIGVLYSLFFREPKYKSTTSIILKNDISQSAILTVNDLSINQDLVSTYSEVVKSKRILKKVIKNLKLDYSCAELSSIISVSSVSDTEIIKITVTNEDSNTAKLIANEVANVFVEEIPYLYNISNVSVLDEAEVSKYPYNINIKRQIVIYLIIGLMLGFSVVFLIYYFDRTIKSAEQVEKKLGLTILGTVQDYEKGI